MHTEEKIVGYCWIHRGIWIVHFHWGTFKNISRKPYSCISDISHLTLIIRVEIKSHMFIMSSYTCHRKHNLCALQSSDLFLCWWTHKPSTARRNVLWKLKMHFLIYCCSGEKTEKSGLRQLLNWLAMSLASSYSQPYIISFWVWAGLLRSDGISMLE